MREPKTPAEWQEAVDAAHFGLCVDSAIQYGLVKFTGRGKINVERCLEILKRGKKLGFQPKEI
jgi:hypothetical protein